MYKLDLVNQRWAKWFAQLTLDLKMHPENGYGMLRQMSLQQSSDFLKKPDTESTSHKGCERSAGRVAPTNTQGRFKRDASRNAWSITGWWFLKVFKCFSMIAEATANTSEFEHIYKLWISMNCFVLRSLDKSFTSCFYFASSDDHWMIPLARPCRSGRRATATVTEWAQSQDW